MEQKPIFPEENCLTEKELMGYLQGTLPEKDKPRIQHHLSGCTLCSEALEGIAGIQPASELPVMMHQINGWVIRHLKRHSRKRRIRQFYIMICLTVFIVLVLTLVAYLSFHYAAVKGSRPHRRMNHSGAPMHRTAAAKGDQ
jgi:hypothetical protein